MYSVLSAYDGPESPVRDREQQRLFHCLRVALAISTIAMAAQHQQLRGQELTTKAPQAGTTQIGPAFPGGGSIAVLPDAPSAVTSSKGTFTAHEEIPRATPLLPASSEKMVLEAELKSRHGDRYLLSGNVDITVRDTTVHADTVTYDDATGELDAQGHVHFSSAVRDESMDASRAVYNLHSGTGRFYDVKGSIGVRGAASGSAHGVANSGAFLFQGRLIVKTGPENYDVYDGSVTSCLLASPDWSLSSRHIALDRGQAHARGTTFRLLGVPLFYLPYVTHPVDTSQRQAGVLIPVLGQSSTKGLIIGDQVYFSLGRSADLTAGLEYFSSRGYRESGTVRYRGPGDDFLNAHVSALQDRGYIDAATNLYINQGGEDVTASFRRQFTPNTRAVGDVEYLSSYTYREAFTENFNQAVSSDITSVGYIVRQGNGFAIDGRVDRYQGLKRVPIGTQPGQQVRIFHAPSFDLTAVDHHLGKSPLLWSFTGSAAGLKRVQPNFTSSGIIERLDLRPELSLPLSGGGWHTLTSAAVRETFYSRSRRTPYAAPGAPPLELTQSVNRTLFDLRADIRPPAIERTFAVPPALQRLFGTEVRHTVEPELTYRNTRGVNNFLSLLRFDSEDLASDTNELEYGVTQHLYFRPTPRSTAKPCPATPSIQTAQAVEAEIEATEEADDDAQNGPGTAERQSADAHLPDVLEPTPGSSTDANGIPSASATAPDAPLRTVSRRHSARNPVCDPGPDAAGLANTSQQEWFSWRLAQRHFFDPSFGGAVLNTRRNLFDSTLSLSGIAFLTEPRDISPLISRMRFRTSSHTDVEWDFDLDTGASKFTSNNIFVDAREGPWFGGVSYARLNAPGRFSKENLDTNQLVSSPTSNFSQMRVLLGYGNPVKPGLSVAANAGLDIILGSAQYVAAQTSYNWNCCGFAVEYRKYELGSVRNENAYRFNFTLANIGTAGNLRRAERLF